MTETTPETSPGAEAPQDYPDLTPEARARIQQIAERQRRARSLTLRAISFVGNQVEDGLKFLPKTVRTQLDDVARAALRQSYDLAVRSRGGMGEGIGSDGVHLFAGTVTGAIGGFGGLPTAIAELPVTTTLIFRAVLHVAEDYGEDPSHPETAKACLAVFGAGVPEDPVDAVDTTFIGARLSLSGAAVSGLIRKVAPRFAAVLSQKLATQAVPIIGAAAGAGTNYAFVDYYVRLAHVHFGLRQMGRIYGEQAVNDAFHEALLPVRT